MGQSLDIPRVIPEDWKRLDLIINKIRFKLGHQSSPTFAGLTLSTGPLNLSGKLIAGSFASPIDVTNTRQYGFELHYSGNDYDVTGIRSRAQLVTTDTTATAQGALLQAANNDGINVGVLNGALIEAVGKSNANAATIAVMRACLVNTEWGDYDTVTNLKTLHVRTHSRNAAGAGSFGIGYGIYIENEAVGGNGQAWDAGIYFKETNLSAGNKAFTYGIDFTGGTYGTSQINLITCGSITMAGTQVIKFDDTNYNMLFGSDAFGGRPGGITQAQNEGEENVGFGYRAGYNNDFSGGGNEGTSNIFIGYEAGRGAAGGLTSFESVGIGKFALYNLSSGVGNFGIGAYSLYATTIGAENVAVGAYSGQNNTDGNSNVYIGAGAGRYVDGSTNVAIGKGALAGSGNPDVNYNIAIGYAALDAVNGAGAERNHAIGWHTLGKVTTGSNNVALGMQAGTDLTTGGYNILIGNQSGFDLTGSHNIFIGHESGYRQVAISNRLIIDNQDRGSIAAEITDCLIYGIFNATVATQSVRFNVGDLTLASGTPYQTLWNTTHEDSDGGRESRISFKGEQSGQEVTTLARIEVGHDGNADDEKGKIVFSVNDGNDVNTPTQALEIGSDLLATFAGSIKVSESITGIERNADPAEPIEGEYVIWLSNGAGYGDDGDVCVASKAAGTTKKAILFDHSAGDTW